MVDDAVVGARHAHAVHGFLAEVADPGTHVADDNVAGEHAECVPGDAYAVSRRGLAGRVNVAAVRWNDQLTCVQFTQSFPAKPLAPGH